MSGILTRDTGHCFFARILYGDSYEMYALYTDNFEIVIELTSDDERVIIGP